MSCIPKSVTVQSVYDGVLRADQTGSIFGNRVEDRPQVFGRTSNKPQHLARGILPLQRLRELLT
jgi:hypothetical protein